jgi:hypothetical protein
MFTEDQLGTIKIAVDNHYSTMTVDLRGLLPAGAEDGMDDAERELLEHEIMLCEQILEILANA